MTFTKKIFENGTAEYRNAEGGLHRLDGSPIEQENDLKQWLFENQRHRIDGPTVFSHDGSELWFLNGMRHRDDGPAVIYKNGTKQWYRNDLLHREDGPAYIGANGTEIWYLQDKKVEKKIVDNLNSLTVDLIHTVNNTELRAWLIGKFGWLKYLAETKAKPIHVRDNLVENTKEALYWVKKARQKQLIVTCPTGRVFNLHVPNDIKTCEEAQRWLGNDVKNEFNVIGRT